MSGIIRSYLIVSQVLLAVIGLLLIFNQPLLLGESGYMIGTRFTAMILGFALLGLSLPTLVASLRGDVKALGYLLWALLVLHAPMAFAFTFNIGAFDYAYAATGQTVATWMAIWIVVFGAPTLFSLLFLRAGDL